ncbi:hypothetical protein AMTRI_Chr13g117860 [Amborella trichopoda]
MMDVKSLSCFTFFFLLASCLSLSLTSFYSSLVALFPLLPALLPALPSFFSLLHPSLSNLFLFKLSSIFLSRNSGSGPPMGLSQKSYKTSYGTYFTK